MGVTGSKGGKAGVTSAAGGSGGGGGGGSATATAGAAHGATTGGGGAAPANPVALAAAREAVLTASAALPPVVEIDGVAEVGADVRVRVANPRQLDSLSIFWFRFTAPPTPVPAADADITTVADCKLLPGATGNVYTIADGDAGSRIGCIVRPGSAIASRWALLDAVVTRGDVTVPGIRLTVANHTHNKYCDRRSRVCTAAGRYREGNTLLAVLKGSAETLTASKVVWYRSDVVDTLQLGASGARQMAAEGSATAAAPASASATASATDDTVPAAGAAAGAAVAAPIAHAGSALANPRHSRIWAALPAVIYRRIAARPGDAIPDCPPDYLPSLSAAEVADHMRKLSLPRPLLPPGDDASAWVGGAVGGAVPGSSAGADGAGGSHSYPLFRDDIGRFVCAVVLARDSAEPDAISIVPPILGSTATAFRVQSVDGADVAGARCVSTPAGPIEAAPPKARDIWIDAPHVPPMVGDVLAGHVYYYGGFPGACNVGWIAIDEAGETVEVAALTPVELSAPIAGEWR